jgi:hypothetical protein
VSIQFAETAKNKARFLRNEANGGFACDFKEAKMNDAVMAQDTLGCARSYVSPSLLETVVAALTHPAERRTRREATRALNSSAKRGQTFWPKRTQQGILVLIQGARSCHS